jgi:hypothetical protein
MKMEEEEEDVDIDEEEEGEDEDEGVAGEFEDDSDVDDSERERRQRAKARVNAQQPTRRSKKFEVNYTVGRIEDGDAILLSSEHNILNVPLSLLPEGIRAG